VRFMSASTAYWDDEVRCYIDPLTGEHIPPEDETRWLRKLREHRQRVGSERK